MGFADVCLLISFVLLLVLTGLLLYHSFVFLPDLLRRVETLENTQTNKVISIRGKHHK